MRLVCETCVRDLFVRRVCSKCLFDVFVRLAELACSPCETEWEPEEDVGIRCDDGDNLCGSDEDKVGGDREDDSREERFDLKKGFKRE